MNRPFFRSSIIEIENEYSKRNIGENIEDIVYELSFRNSRRAKKLYNMIKNSKNKIEQSTNNKDYKFSYIKKKDVNEIKDELNTLISNDDDIIQIDDE